MAQAQAALCSCPNCPLIAQAVAKDTATIKIDMPEDLFFM